VRPLQGTLPFGGHIAPARGNEQTDAVGIGMERNACMAKGARFVLALPTRKLNGLASFAGDLAGSQLVSPRRFCYDGKNYDG